MNWTHFLLWLAVIYSLYYITIILLDLAATKRNSIAGGKPELTFTEQVTPVRLNNSTETKPDLKPKSGKPEPAEVLGSGGVPLSDLFRLARQDAIIYTRAVSY